MTRRLAAILVADIVGYSRLVEADEAGTLARIKSLLTEAIEPLIAEHGGRIFKRVGDGLLVEFGSAVDAVSCAIAVQGRMAELDATLDERQRIKLRIGVNVGDVVVEDDDLFGDGVNIASRLEALAEPGGLLISGTAFDQIEKRLQVSQIFLGEQRLKNIERPVRLYKIVPESPVVEQNHSPSIMETFFRWRPKVAHLILAFIVGSALIWLVISTYSTEEISAISDSENPQVRTSSIAVLPFANMSNDSQQGYFADGIADDLITDLSRISSLFVISRNSSFSYRDKQLALRQIAQELGVRYILEGTVRRSGDEVRINVQLVDATTDQTAWAERFDGRMADVFLIQDTVTSAVVDALSLRLSESEQQLLKEAETTIPDAYDSFLKGWELYRRNNPSDLKAALPHFEAALALDPSYGRAAAARALVYARAYIEGWNNEFGMTRSGVRHQSNKYLQKAQEFQTALSHQVAGILLESEWMHEAAIGELRTAIALEPGDPWSHAILALTLTSAGHAEKAKPEIELAMRLDPHAPSFFFHVLALTEFSLGQYEVAASAAERSIRLSPGYDVSYALLAAAYGYLDRKEDGIATFQRYNAIRVGRGDVSIALSSLSSCKLCSALDLSQEDDQKRLFDGLKALGSPERLIDDRFREEALLTPSQIQDLLFGHQIHGRNNITGESRSAEFTADGIASLVGDWASTGGGVMKNATSTFERDRLCLLWSGTVKFCGKVLRNPGGTTEQKNEYLHYHGTQIYTFSRFDSAP